MKQAVIEARRKKGVEKENDILEEIKKEVKMEEKKSFKNDFKKEVKKEIKKEKGVIIWNSKQKTYGKDFY